LVQGPWGATGGSERRAGVAAAGVRWIEVRLLSVRFAGVLRVGIGQGNIVHSGGDLGVALFRFVGYAVGDTMLDKKKGLVQ